MLSKGSSVLSKGSSEFPVTNYCNTDLDYKAEERWAACTLSEGNVNTKN